MRFELSKSSYPDGKIRHIARDTSGVVRLRADNLEELQDAIREYNKTLAKQAEERIKAKAKSKSKGAKGKEESEEINETPPETKEVVIEAAETSILDPEPVEVEPTEPKKFLTSDIKEQIEEKKRRSGKKNFWDKLK